MIIDYDYEVYTDGGYDPVKNKYAYAYVFVKDGSIMHEDSGLGTNPDAASMQNVTGE